MKCAEQDYVELACLFNMPVLIRLQDGSEIKGTAKNTNYNKQKQECIVLHSAEGDCSIALNLIVLMQTQYANPHFSEIKFSESLAAKDNA